MSARSPSCWGVVRPNAAILSNRCHVILVRNAQKTAELNFDQHEELVTELYPVRELKEMVRRGEITHSIGLNSIMMLLLELILNTCFFLKILYRLCLYRVIHNW